MRQDPGVFTVSLLWGKMVCMQLHTSVKTILKTASVGTMRFRVLRKSGCCCVCTPRSMQALGEMLHFHLSSPFSPKQGYP